jgi:hypothetical protein
VPQYGSAVTVSISPAAHPQDPDRMVLAIETDGASYRQSGSVRDRDRLCGEHLQRLGWAFQRLWSTDWFQSPHAEVAKLRDAYQRPVAAAGPQAAAGPAATETPDASKPRTTPGPPIARHVGTARHAGTARHGNAEARGA